MSANIGGVIFVKAGGKILSAEGTVNVMLSDKEREEKVGADGQVFYTETPIAPFVEGTFYLAEGLNPHDFDGMTDATVKVQVGSGATKRTGTLRNAFCTGAIAVDTSAGTFPLKFVGKEGKWD